MSIYLHWSHTESPWYIKELIEVFFFLYLTFNSIICPLFNLNQYNSNNILSNNSNHQHIRDAYTSIFLESYSHSRTYFHWLFYSWFSFFIFGMIRLWGSDEFGVEMFRQLEKKIHNQYRQFSFSIQQKQEELARTCFYFYGMNTCHLTDVSQCHDIFSI